MIHLFCCFIVCVCGTATKLQLMHPVHNLRYMHAWTLNSIDISALRKLLLRFRQCFDVPNRLWGRTAGTRLTPRLWFAYQHGIGPYAPTLPLGMCAPTLERLSSEQKWSNDDALDAVFPSSPPFLALSDSAWVSELLFLLFFS